MSNIHYKLAEKTRGICMGGIGTAHRLAEKTGLIDAIDRHVHVLKIHLPYHESDHVLNLAYNALCEGIRLEDIELRRNDEVFLGKSVLMGAMPMEDMDLVISPSAETVIVNPKSPNSPSAIVK